MISSYYYISPANLTRHKKAAVAQLPYFVSKCQVQCFTTSPCPGMYLSYSICLAMRSASASPFSFATRCSAPSMPAEMPAVVITRPLSTYRTLSITLAEGTAFCNDRMLL